MRSVKVKFVGFWQGFNPDDFLMFQLMKKHYDVCICEDPDYVICSCFGWNECLKYDQVRIMFSGENYIPDFNHMDYGVSVYPVRFQDRHFSFPGMVGINHGILTVLAQKDRNYSQEIFSGKSCFANIVTSHESENGIRGELFRALNAYKRVESGGTYLNNMPGGIPVWGKEKTELQKKCKFTICPESTVHRGFITEKIFDAFYADTIPIYCGSPTAFEIINKGAYLDVNDFDSVEDLVKRIIELDTNDEKYLEMLRQPVFVQQNYVEDKIREFEMFITNIFDQPLEKAYRRSRVYMPKRVEDQIVRSVQIEKDFDNGQFRSKTWISQQIAIKIKEKLTAVLKRNHNSSPKMGEKK